MADRLSLAVSGVIAAMVGCGNGHSGAAPDAPASSDASPDAGVPRAALGVRLVDHDAVIQGVTSDGYVIYTDTPNGSPVAHAIPLDGGADRVIATSASSSRDDVRVAISGALVFVWSGRGNRSATLTLWSAALGAVQRSTVARPGRAAATADGTRILYEQNGAAAAADIVTGPLAGPDVVIDTANTQDGTCWRDTDLVAVAGRVVARYCPPGATAWRLRSIAPDGTSVDLTQSADRALYTASRAVWLEAGGTLRASADALTSTVIASDAAEMALTRDAAQLVYRSTSGAIAAGPSAGKASDFAALVTGGAMQLGALAPDGRHVLYATALRSAAAADVAPYADVRVAGGGATTALVAGTTSCAACLRDSFTADAGYALVLDPIDNSKTGAGRGAIAVHAVGDGKPLSRFGQSTYQAIRIDGSGAATRFVFIAAERDQKLLTGWAYQLTLRALDGSAAELALLSAAENFWLDAGRGLLVSSFGGTDAVAGIWVYRFDRPAELAGPAAAATTPPVTGRRWAGAPDED